MDANELVGPLYCAALYRAVMLLMKIFMSAVRDKEKRPVSDGPLEIEEKNIKIDRVLKRPWISSPFRNVVCATRRRKKLRIARNYVFRNVVNNAGSINSSEHKMPTESSLQSVVEMVERPTVDVRQSSPRSPAQDLADAKVAQGVDVNLLPSKESVDISPRYEEPKKTTPAEKEGSAMTCLDEEKLQRADSKMPQSCVDLHGKTSRKLQFVKPTTPSTEEETKNSDENKEKATMTGARLDGILPVASYTDEITSDGINSSSAQTARSEKNVANDDLHQDDPQELNNDETTEIELDGRTFNTHHSVDNGIAVMIKMLKGDVCIEVKNVTNEKVHLASAWGFDTSFDSTPDIYDEYQNIMQQCREAAITPLNVHGNVWAVGFDHERVNCQVCYDQPFEDVCAICGLRICRRPQCGRHGCRNEFQKAFVD